MFNIELFCFLLDKRCLLNFLLIFLIARKICDPHSTFDSTLLAGIRSSLALADAFPPDLDVLNDCWQEIKDPSTKANIPSTVPPSLSANGAVWSVVGGIVLSTRSSGGYSDGSDSTLTTGHMSHERGRKKALLVRILCSALRIKDYHSTSTLIPGIIDWNHV